MNIFKLLALSFVSVASALSASVAMAAPITLVGNSFDVIYANSLAGLFGIPTLSNDSIFLRQLRLKQNR